MKDYFPEYYELVPGKVAVVTGGYGVFVLTMVEGLAAAEAIVGKRTRVEGKTERFPARRSKCTENSLKNISETILYFRG